MTQYQTILVRKNSVKLFDSLFTDLFNPEMLELVDIELSHYNYQTYYPQANSNLVDFFLMPGDTST